MLSPDDVKAEMIDIKLTSRRSVQRSPSTKPPSTLLLSHFIIYSRTSNLANKMSTAYLITGAARGIGKGLTSALLLRPDTTVIAGVRDVASATSVLTDLPKGSGSKLIIVHLDSCSETSPAAAVTELANTHSITSLDVLIANAGIARSGSPILSTTSSALLEHFTVNTIAPVLLLQAFAPLLQRSATANPKFLALSTVLGSIATQDKLPTGISPYGATKAALNWLVKRVHIEEQWLTAYVAHPGLVITDMGRAFAGGDEGARQLGAISVEESVEGMLETLDGATREGRGGGFWNVDGGALPW